MRLLSLSLAGALVAYLAYTIVPLFHRRLVVLGALRHYPEDVFKKDPVVVIPDTVQCEDLHYHAQSGTIFTACEDNFENRFKWFPPLANFDNPEAASKSQGSIHVIDPKTLQSRRLEFTNFASPFITHGIDVISDPTRPDGEAVYIFAVNHLPNPDFSPSASPAVPRARSQLELFHHVVGTATVQHVRSIWHPLIRTPNDLFAASPTSVYVTNDHRHANHGLMRTMEDLYAGAKWTDVVHIRLDESLGTTTTTTASATDGVSASVALDNVHNANGLGHGRSPREMLLASCTSGLMHIGEVPDPAGTDGNKNPNITLRDAVTIDHVVDNPTYFADPYASNDDGGGAGDKSGFVIAGLSKAVDLSKTMRDVAATEPVMVTYVTQKKKNEQGSGGKWEKRVLFEDDGSRLRSASAAVLVGIDPAEEDGKRRAWLFVTGFLAKAVVAMKVDL
ncbi:hypothetical protein VTK26DRAFT_1789 [Humicola hyalothermophila]